MSARRFWFHCSAVSHGKEWVADRLCPRVPDGEPRTPRLCVAESVAGCFAATVFCHGGPVYVYSNELPRRAVTPRNVWDAIITHERWLIPPVRMVLAKIIDPATVIDAQRDILQFHREACQMSDHWLRIAQYAIALDVLGGSRWERLFIANALRRLDMGEPREYIRKRMASALQGDSVPA